jgi:hypothetical protein
MRSRTAVLAGALAILAIAAVPMARAESQTTITQRELSSDGGHASYDLDSLIALQVQVPQAAEIRIFKADSAGRKLLVLQVRDLPNPAGYRSTRSERAFRSSAQLAFRDTRSTANYAERSSLPVATSPIRSDRHYNQRFTPALRGAALIGTLVRERRLTTL